MSDQNIDPKIEQIAKETAAQEMERLQNNLIARISGTKPETPPESWSSFKNDTAEYAVNKAEEKIMARLKKEQDEETSKKEAEKQVLEQRSKADTEKEWADQSAQWKEAVEDGLMPAIKPEIATVLKEWQTNKGRPLTQEELNDPGVKAYAEAKALHDKLSSEGKSTNFYRTIQKFYNKRPAGAAAPVMGSSRAIAPESGYTYAEIHKAALNKMYHRHG